MRKTGFGACAVALLVASFATACSGNSCNARKTGISTVEASSATVQPVAAPGGAPAEAAAGRQASTPESLARVLDQIEASQAKVPRDRLDPSVLLEAGREPAALLAWVRAQTRLASYEGSLRGPLGVLMDRRGNNLDRALLTARLFGLAGYEARVVGGTLQPGEAAKVVAEGSAPPPGTAPQPAGGASGSKELEQQVAGITELIVARTGPLALAEPVPESRHYWVQYRAGGAWMDADPTLAGLGQARPAVDVRVVPIDAKTHAVARPAVEASDLVHAVAMRLVIERWEAGRLAESALMAVPFDASGGPLVEVTVTFVPVDKAKGKAVQRSFASGAELRGRLLTETAWAPAVSRGSASWSLGPTFDDAGLVGARPRAFDGSASMANATSSSFGGIVDFGGADAVQQAATVLTAAAVDYEIRVPGKAVRTVRRFVFDALGPEARRASRLAAIPRPKWTSQQVLDRGADLAAVNETLVAYASLSPDAYIRRFAQRAIDAKAAILRLAGGASDNATLEQAANGLSLRPLELFAAARDSAMDSGLALTEPQVFRRVVRYVPDKHATGLDALVFGDLVWNRLGAPGGGVTATALAAQGVRDTLQESAIVLRASPPRPGETTAALFAEAARLSVEVVLVREGSDKRVSVYPGPARARMLQDLDAGQWLVAPRKPVTVDGQPRVGWWRVDPHTAQVVGAMDTGLLQETTEYTVTEEVNGIHIVRFVKRPIARQVREWANHIIRKRDYTSWEQWENLLSMAQKSWDVAGMLPM